VTGAVTTLLPVAVMLPAACTLTGSVFTGNVALVEPCGTVTLAGTVMVGVLLLRPTVTPPAGAGLASVTVPVVDCPPANVGDWTVTPDKGAVFVLAAGAAAVMFIAAETLAPAPLAVTVAVPGAADALVDTRNCALV
jgi:hypothetical protein